MQYIDFYSSPVGELMLACDEMGLLGVWFKGKQHYASVLKKDEPTEQKRVPLLEETRKWLDVYFQGKNPNFMPKISLRGSEFQLAVWSILEKIPYGGVVTYGDLAKEIAKERGIRRMSAQAVGGAVGRNPVSILVPCHRVVGANGNLVGYGGGIEKKIELLKLEGIDMTKYHLPSTKKKTEEK